MARVVAVDVVVPLEIAAVGKITVTEIPVARGGDTMNQPAVVQHRQVETAAIP